MRASVQYGDFKGTVEADISDHLHGAGLDTIAKHFKLDTERFKIVGLSIYGTDEFDVSFLCIDLQESTAEKEVIVNLSMSTLDNPITLDVLFKRLHIVLHNRFDDKYLNPTLEYDKELTLDEDEEED
jgi:hypothetical protein